MVGRCRSDGVIGGKRPIECHNRRPPYRRQSRPTWLLIDGQAVGSSAVSMRRVPTQTDCRQDCSVASDFYSAMAIQAAGETVKTSIDFLSAFSTPTQQRWGSQAVITGSGKCRTTQREFETSHAIGHSRVCHSIAVLLLCTRTWTLSVLYLHGGHVSSTVQPSMRRCGVGRRMLLRGNDLDPSKDKEIRLAIFEREQNDESKTETADEGSSAHTSPSSIRSLSVAAD